MEEHRDVINKIFSICPNASSFKIGDTIYDERSMPWAKRFELISKISGFVDMNKNTKTRILDTCCGIGTNSFIISELFPKTKIDAVDIDKKRIEAGRLIASTNKIYSNITFIESDEMHIDISSYELIISSAINTSFASVVNRIGESKLKHFSGHILFLLPTLGNWRDEIDIEYEDKKKRDELTEEIVKNFKGIKIVTERQEDFVLSDAVLVSV